MSSLLGALLLLSVADARPKTWCVGGYNGEPPSVVAACGRPEIAKQHRRWHEHNYLRRGDECFICWDEVDSSCVRDFLRNHPDYTKVRNLFACKRQANADTVIGHRIAGQDQVGTTVTPRLDGVSAGPYTAGDSITLRGAVRDAAGDIVLVPSADFRLTLGDGTVVDVPGVLQADGSFAADVVLPDTDGLDVMFRPAKKGLAKGVTLAAPRSDPLSLKVDACAYRSAVVEPVAGSALVVDQQATFRAAFTRDGAPASPSSPTLTYTLSRSGAPDVVLQSGPDGSASWTPDASWRDARVSIRVGGRSEGLQVCPAGSVSVHVSELGLGLDVQGLPERCYAGVPCTGVATLIRPADQARVDALLSDPGTTVALYSGPDELAVLPVSADDRYRFETTYAEVQKAVWRVEVRGPRGTVSLPMHELAVRLPLKLRLPDVLDFGVVPAGTGFTEACAGLDFAKSQAAQEHRWEVVATGLEGCQSTPVLAFANLFGFADHVPLSVSATVEALDPRRPVLDVCLEVPRCAADASGATTALVVRPLTPEFADQERRVALRWTVEGRGWLDCHGWWLWPLLALIGTVGGVAGFVLPHRFPGHVAVRVASSVAALKRASAVGLVGLPGSGSGWYRHAALGIHRSGEISRDVRHAAVVIAATAGGVELRGGGVEERDRRTGRWKAVETPLEPSASAVYRVGEVVFRVES